MKLVAEAAEQAHTTARAQLQAPEMPLLESEHFDAATVDQMAACAPAAAEEEAEKEHIVPNGFTPATVRAGGRACCDPPAKRRRPLANLTAGRGDHQA